MAFRILMLTVLILLEVSHLYGQVNLDSILHLYTEAIGGKAEWEKVKSFKLDMIGTSNSGQVLLEQYMLKPYCFKMVFHFNSANRVLTYDGLNGQILDNGKIKEMPKDMQIEMREEPDFYDELIFYQEKNYSISHEPDTLIDNKHYAKIALKKSDHDIQYYYLNLENHLVEIVEEYSEEEKFKGTLFKTTFSAYQKIDQILFPKRMSLYGNDILLVDYDITKVILNPELSKSDFRLE